jgi:hypothetical protein
MNGLRAIVQVRRLAVARLAATLLIALTVLPFTAPFAVFDPSEYTEGTSALWDNVAGKDVHDVGMTESIGSDLATVPLAAFDVVASLMCEIVPARRALVLRI